MVEPNHTSTTSSSTSSTDSSHSEPNSLTSFDRNDQQLARVFGALHPWIFTLPCTPSDTLPTDRDALPVMAEPRAGTLACFGLERNLALAVDTPLESNLAAKDSGEVPTSAMEKRMARAKKKLRTAHERSEMSGSKNQLIPKGSQTGGIIASASNRGESSASGECPCITGYGGVQRSPVELAKVLKRLYDERAKQNMSAGKSGCGYLSCLKCLRG